MIKEERKECIFLAFLLGETTLTFVLTQKYSHQSTVSSLFVCWVSLFFPFFIFVTVFSFAHLSFFENQTNKQKLEKTKVKQFSTFFCSFFSHWKVIYMSKRFPSNSLARCDIVWIVWIVWIVLFCLGTNTSAKTSKQVNSTITAIFREISRLIVSPNSSFWGQLNLVSQSSPIKACIYVLVVWWRVRGRLAVGKFVRNDLSTNLIRIGVVVPSRMDHRKSLVLLHHKKTKNVKWE